MLLQLPPTTHTRPWCPWTPKATEARTWRSTRAAPGPTSSPATTSSPRSPWPSRTPPTSDPWLNGTRPPVVPLRRQRSQWPLRSPQRPPRKLQSRLRHHVPLISLYKELFYFLSSCSISSGNDVHKSLQACRRIFELSSSSTQRQKYRTSLCCRTSCHS